MVDWSQFEEIRAPFHFSFWAVSFKKPSG
jgi:hypothetical protein